MQLTISLLQANLVWENPQANLDNFAAKITQLPATDLIILPEMFSTGFSMNAKALAETMEGPTIQWMKQMAVKQKAVITGSLIIQEAGNYYNRLIWMRSNGSFEYYDKKHLFTMAKEEETYTAGQQKVLIEYKGWTICPFICYDLRFPIWNRNQEDYDLAIYVANWPDKRAHHWNSLLMARAIENQAYIVAVNRVGTDGKGFYYSGYSTVLDPAGDILYQQADKEDNHTIILDINNLQDTRKRLPFLKDRD